MKISKDLKGKCGVYCLLNTDNGKRYVGLSTDIYNRVMKHRSHLRHNKHQNSHLQSAFNIGYNFEIIVLCECSIEELDTMEIQYMNDYNVLNPKYGYNLADGGGKGNGLKGEQCGNYNTSIFTFYNEDGKVEKDITCYKLIKKYNLTDKVYGMVKGRITSVKGWRLSIDKIWEKRYDFYHTEGTVEKQSTQMEFCNKYNLDNSSISRVVRGQLDHCGGWSTTPDKKVHREARNKKYSVVSDNGLTLILDKTIKEIAVLLGCSPRSINKLVRGEYNTVKGFKVLNY